MTDNITPTLGETPFILIEANADTDSSAGFDLSVRAGGGIDDHDQLVTMLLLVVEQITGVGTDLYVKEIDLTRAAAGLGPFRRAA